MISFSVFEVLVIIIVFVLVGSVSMLSSPSFSFSSWKADRVFVVDAVVIQEIGLSQWCSYVAENVSVLLSSFSSTVEAVVAGEVIVVGVAECNDIVVLTNAVVLGIIFPVVPIPILL